MIKYIWQSFNMQKEDVGLSYAIEKYNCRGVYLCLYDLYMYIDYISIFKGKHSPLG